MVTEGPESQEYNCTWKTSCEQCWQSVVPMWPRNLKDLWLHLVHLNVYPFADSSLQCLCFLQSQQGLNTSPFWPPCIRFVSAVWTACGAFVVWRTWKSWDWGTRRMTSPTPRVCFPPTQTTPSACSQLLWCWMVCIHGFCLLSQVEGVSPLWESDYTPTIQISCPLTHTLVYLLC